MPDESTRLQNKLDKAMNSVLHYNIQINKLMNLRRKQQEIVYEAREKLKMHQSQQTKP